MVGKSGKPGAAGPAGHPVRLRVSSQPFRAIDPYRVLTPYEMAVSPRAVWEIVGACGHSGLAFDLLLANGARLAFVPSQEAGPQESSPSFKTGLLAHTLPNQVEAADWFDCVLDEYREREGVVVLRVAGSPNAVLTAEAAKAACFAIPRNGQAGPDWPPLQFDIPDSAENEMFCQALLQRLLADADWPSGAGALNARLLRGRLAPGTHGGSALSVVAPSEVWSFAALLLSRAGEAFPEGALELLEQIHFERSSTVRTCQVLSRLPQGMLADMQDLLTSWLPGYRLARLDRNPTLGRQIPLRLTVGWALDAYVLSPYRAALYRWLRESSLAPAV